MDFAEFPSGAESRPKAQPDKPITGLVNNALSPPSGSAVLIACLRKIAGWRSLDKSSLRLPGGRFASCATMAGLTEGQLPRPFCPAYWRRVSRVPSILGGPMDHRHEISSNWASGRSSRIPSAMPTAFETRAHELRLTAPTYLESQELRRWCKDNRNKCYIPEWLLKEWGISINSEEL
jgi:hypothetical protein